MAIATLPLGHRGGEKEKERKRERKKNNKRVVSSRATTRAMVLYTGLRLKPQVREQKEFNF